MHCFLWILSIFSLPRVYEKSQRVFLCERATKTKCKLAWDHKVWYDNLQLTKCSCHTMRIECKKLKHEKGWICNYWTRQSATIQVGRCKKANKWDENLKPGKVMSSTKDNMANKSNGHERAWLGCANISTKLKDNTIELMNLITHARETNIILEGCGAKTCQMRSHINIINNIDIMKCQTITTTKGEKVGFISWSSLLGFWLRCAPHNNQI